MDCAFSARHRASRAEYNTQDLIQECFMDPDIYAAAVEAIAAERAEFWGSR